MHSLRDSLRQLHKGSSAVTEYGRMFKAICDQLSAIGQPIDEQDKAHWFLLGLGPSYESFSTTHRALKPLPFRNLLSQAESHELFINSIHQSSNPPAVAFKSQQYRSSQSSSRGGTLNMGNFSGGGGGGQKQFFWWQRTWVQTPTLPAVPHQWALCLCMPRSCYLSAKHSHQC